MTEYTVTENIKCALVSNVKTSVCPSFQRYTPGNHIIHKSDIHKIHSSSLMFVFHTLSIHVVHSSPIMYVSHTLSIHIIQSSLIILHECWKNKLNKISYFVLTAKDIVALINNGLTGFHIQFVCSKKDNCEFYAIFPIIVNTVNMFIVHIYLLFTVTNTLKATLWKVNGIPYVTRNKPINFIMLVLEFNLILLSRRAYNLCGWHLD